MRNYLWKYFLPGAALILCAFWAGMLSSPAFALLGFLSFFVIGVTLIMEGKKALNRQRTERSDKPGR